MGKEFNNSEFKKEYIDAMLNCCINFSERICELHNYYLINFKAIKDNHQQQKEKFDISFKLLDLFESVYDGKTPKDRLNRFEEIKSIKICGNKCLLDLFSEFEYDDNIMGFSYVFKPEIRNFKNYLPSKARKINKIYSYLITRLKSSILSSLISTYESFLSCVYSNLIYNNQPLYFGSKSITLQKLITNNLDDIIEEQINEIVESEVFNSIELTKKILEKENINQSFISPLLDDYTEICSRRNIYIHNDGFVNKVYLNSVPSCKSKIGTYLKCDEKYYVDSIVTLEKLMFYLTFKVLEKEELQDKDFDTILDFYFDKLVNEEYKTTEFVFNVLSRSKKLDFANKMICEVNYLISLKHLGKTDEFKREIDSFDVTAADKPFKIAKLVLLNQFKEASEMIEESYSNKNTPNELLNWPLYKDFRNSEYYQSIVSNHKDDFVSEELSGDDKIEYNIDGLEARK